MFLLTYLLCMMWNYARGVVTELYILWSELSRHKLLPTLAIAHYSCPDNAIGLVAQCGLGRYVELD